MSSQNRKQNSGLEKWIRTVQDEKTRSYLRIRVLPRLEHYSTAGSRNRKLYLRLKTLIIILGAVIPVAALFIDVSVIAKVISAAAGASVSALTAFLELKGSHTIWITCHARKELLDGLLMQYFTETGKFAGQMGQEEKDAVLIGMCEQYMAEEGNTTISRK